jgi:hypothetical protein
MDPQQLRDLLETQRQALIDMFEKERYELLDKYIKLQIKYDEMKTDRDILSRRYNELVKEASSMTS